jgi:hypothetical protein
MGKRKYYNSSKFYWLTNDYDCSYSFKTRKYPAFDNHNIPSKKLNKINDEEHFCSIFEVDKFSN